MSNERMSSRDAVVVSLLSLSHKGETGKTNNLQKWFMKSAAMDTDIRNMKCFLEEVSGLINEGNISIDMSGDLPSAIFEISKDMREFYKEYMPNTPIDKTEILDRLRHEYGAPTQIDEHTYRWRKGNLQLQTSLLSDAIIFYEVSKISELSSDLSDDRVAMIASGTVYSAYHIENRTNQFIDSLKSFGFSYNLV